MTFQPMRGVKIVEVAQFTFTPSAGAVMADWGADVVKVEHAVTGDAQRGPDGRPNRLHHQHASRSESLPVQVGHDAGSTSFAQRSSIVWRGRITVQRSPSTMTSAARGRAL